MKLVLAFAAAAASVALVATPASAAVTFDASTGVGFVGKGDVQLALGMNNKQLQDAVSAGSVHFDYSLTSTTSATWTCDKDSGPQTQERSNTTTTSTQGLGEVVARTKNQVTGWILTGYDESVRQTSRVTGQPLGSCPTGWSAIDVVEGEPVVTGGGLTVNGVPLS